jgi:hypothetical protein
VYEVGADGVTGSGAIHPEGVGAPRVEPVGLGLDVQDLVLAAEALGLMVEYQSGGCRMPGRDGRWVVRGSRRGLRSYLSRLPTAPNIWFGATLVFGADSPFSRPAVTVNRRPVILGTFQLLLVASFQLEFLFGG